MVATDVFFTTILGYRRKKMLCLVSNLHSIFLFPDCSVVGGGLSHSWDPTWSLWKGSCTATPCRKCDLQETTTTRWHCSPFVSLSYINVVLSLHIMLHYSILLSHNMPNYYMLVLYHVTVCFITLYCIIVMCHHYHILSPTSFYYIPSHAMTCPFL